jgi:hypothetical protein
MNKQEQIAMDLIALGLRSLAKTGNFHPDDVIPLVAKLETDQSEDALNWSIALHRKVDSFLHNAGWYQIGDNTWATKLGQGRERVNLTDVQIETTIEAAIGKMIRDAIVRSTR